jgi:enoyl-CoA hydratase/carnithine racemase
MAESLHSQPPDSKYFQLSFPKPGVILVTINREQQRNSLPSDAHWEGHNLFTWFDEEPTLLVAVVTGAGEKAFCAGQDLAEQNASRRGPKTGEQLAVMNHPPSGFMGLSQRKGKVLSNMTDPNLSAPLTNSFDSIYRNPFSLL